MKPFTATHNNRYDNCVSQCISFSSPPVSQCLWTLTHPSLKTDILSSPLMAFITPFSWCVLINLSHLLHDHYFAGTALSSFDNYPLIFINPLTPDDPYSGHTTPLTSKCGILYIYSINTGTKYFKHGIYSLFLSLLTYLVPVLFTFYIQSVIKFKKIIPVPNGYVILNIKVK